MKGSPLFFLLLALTLLVRPAYAQSDAPDSFRAFLDGVAQEAVDSGVSPITVHTALADIELDDRVIARDRNQPESTITFATYSAQTVSSDRVSLGRALMHKNINVLRLIERRYGVPPEIVVALWGIESSFGANKGDYEIVNSLATLAYEGRRAKFFRRELISALRILDEERMQVSDLQGSWAGAMGQPQFMPTTYLRYAVDFDGDGKRDIWNDDADVLASIAAYLSAEGWQPGLSWGRPVVVKKALPDTLTGLQHQHSLAQWQKLGVRGYGGKLLPSQTLHASLVQPDGFNGRSFLVYDNFRALMRWNRSTYFAASVGLLADQIKAHEQNK